MDASGITCAFPETYDELTALEYFSMAASLLPTFGDRALQFFFGLRAPDSLPPGVEIMNPYGRPEIQSLLRQFYGKFFNDTRQRIFLLGINPGRFGGGAT